MTEPCGFMVGMVQASLRLDALLTPRSAMREEKATADRLTAGYSDAVFAVIMTIMVLDLKAWISRYSRRSGLCGPRPSAMW